jgi:hypothetical protein
MLLDYRSHSYLLSVDRVLAFPSPEKISRSEGANDKTLQGNGKQKSVEYTPYVSARYCMISFDSYMATPVFGSTCNRCVSYISTELIFL